MKIKLTPCYHFYLNHIIKQIVNTPILVMPIKLNYFCFTIVFIIIFKSKKERQI